MRLRSLACPVRVFGLALLASASNLALAFIYFGGGIDYWGEAKAPIDAMTDGPAPADFRWSDHLDPNRDEFFREGD